MRLKKSKKFHESKLLKLNCNKAKKTFGLEKCFKFQRKILN